MPQENWGNKHICQECGAKYYDMGRSPIFCPACGVELIEKPVLSKSSTKIQETKEPKVKETKIDGDNVLPEDILADEDVLPDEDVLEDEDTVLPDLEDEDVANDASSVVEVSTEKNNN